jgi:hypothetical protein
MSKGIGVPYLFGFYPKGDRWYLALEKEAEAG